MEQEQYQSQQRAPETLPSHGLRPTNLQFFKGKGAIRFRPTRPAEFDVGYVMLSIAPAFPGKSARNGDANIYDWQNQKLNAKLGLADIQNILFSLANNANAEMFHEFNGTKKTVKFTLNEERGGYFVSVNETKADGSKNNVSVPITAEETFLLYNLLTAFLPSMFNWN